MTRKPGLVTYEITDLGRRINDQAASLEEAAREQHPDHGAERRTGDDEDPKPDSR